MSDNIAPNKPQQAPPNKRRPYQKPILRELGTLSTMIRGGGGSRFDAINPTNGKPA